MVCLKVSASFKLVLTPYVCLYWDKLWLVHVSPEIKLLILTVLTPHTGLGLDLAYNLLAVVVTQYHIQYVHIALQMDDTVTASLGEFSSQCFQAYWHEHDIGICRATGINKSSHKEQPSLFGIFLLGADKPTAQQ